MSTATVGNIPTNHDSFLRTFQEATPGQLDGKENYLVEYVNGNKVQLLTAAGNEIAVVRQKLMGGAADVTCALLSKDGTQKFVQSAVINEGAKVMSAVGGSVVLATTGHRSLGHKITPGPGAIGDVIEVLMFIEAI